jgi:hypothetical protein
MAAAVKYYCEGKGRVVALEHDSAFAYKTRTALEINELSSHAEIRVAPLSDLDLGEGKWKWYSTDDVQDISDCDLLVVDGPPGPVQTFARYPAFALLASKLRKDAVIILDDFNRADEREIVRKLIEDDPSWQVYEVEHEKGTAVLTRKSFSSHYLSQYPALKAVVDAVYADEVVIADEK